MKIKCSCGAEVECRDPSVMCDFERAVGCFFSTHNCSKKIEPTTVREAAVSDKCLQFDEKSAIMDSITTGLVNVDRIETLDTLNSIMNVFNDKIKERGYSLRLRRDGPEHFVWFEYSNIFDAMARRNGITEGGSKL